MTSPTDLGPRVAASWRALTPEQRLALIDGSPELRAVLARLVAEVNRAATLLKGQAT